MLVLGDSDTFDLDHNKGNSFLNLEKHNDTMKITLFSNNCTDVYINQECITYLEGCIENNIGEVMAVISFKVAFSLRYTKYNYFEIIIMFTNKYDSRFNYFICQSFLYFYMEFETGE